MKRIEALPPLAAVAVLALVGCGGGSSGGGSNASQPKHPSTSTAASPSTPTATPTETTPIKTATTGHRPPCRYCGAGLRPGSAAQAALTATNPAIGCGVLVTPRYVKAAYGGERGCAAAIRGGASAKSARIVGTRRTSAGALVIVIPSGGTNGGEHLKVSLIHEPAMLPGGRTPPLWRVDAIRSNAKVGP